MKFGTVIKLPDGREGTICWSNLDGRGGIWGNKDLSHINLDNCGGFSNDIPEPQFMLRNPELQYLFKAECVGEEYEII